MKGKGSDVRGTSSQRVVLTSSHPPQKPLAQPSLRLVDGPTPMQGRLQIFYKHKWRSICTNSRNWTIEDMSVACRQLGYSGGEYWEWQDRANNDTATMLYEEPRCSGIEDDITKCGSWNTHSMGGGVCDLHPDLGLTCKDEHALWKGTNHWRGLLFYHAEYDSQLYQENTLYQKVSKSSLKYITIEYGGMGPGREAVSAIMSRSVPPQLTNVDILRSAHSGINATLPGTFLHLSGGIIKDNAGYGVYVNTSTGSLLVDGGSRVTENWSDGVHYTFHRREPPRTASETFQDFCTGASNPNQAYPIVTVATQDIYSYNELNCQKEFFIQKMDFVFTVHFSYMQTEEDGAGTVEVRDRDSGGEILTMFEVRNNTFPPSVVSRGNTVWIKVTAKPRKLLVVFMEVIASKYKMFDVRVSDSYVADNSGHGVVAEHMRSLVHIHRTNLTHNLFGSGLNVRGGAGDVNITHSSITRNLGDGVNVTYEGGVQNITWSSITDNELRGVAVWFNESGQNTGIRHETAVAYTDISQNLDVGLRVGNFCRNNFVNISENQFTGGGRGAALEVESCWQRDGGMRVLQIGQNLFRENKRLALKISPAVNMNLTLEYNEFEANQHGTLLIYNEDKVELPGLPFSGRVFRNHFRDNTGWYVLRLALSLLGLDQSLLVDKNTIKGNIVKELYPTYQSRSRASGVVCVGSHNVVLYRNLIDNPGSVYELASHTTDQSSPINATFNWLGSKFERDIFERVLDRRDRYNLALVIFHPFLLSSTNWETPVTETGQMSEPSFFDSTDDHIIGGEVNGEQTLHDGVYTVTRDIYIHETGTLTIAFGTTLEFADGMGMMVAGQLLTEGSGPRDVRFTRQGTSLREAELNRAAYYSGGDDVVSLSNNNTTEANITTLTDVRTLNDTTPTNGEEEEHVDDGPAIPVKLVGGHSSMEGRLMVYVNGMWGTVCEHGWTEYAAAVACQQMGYVLNPEDWLLQPANLPPEGQVASIVMSNVRCDEFDTDITRCKSDLYEELENSCSHSEDVGLRCHAGAWAGIRLGMTARESHIKGVVIEKAGLFDYTTRTFKPALQIDFHRHVIQDVEVRGNIQDGVGIIYTDQYAIANPEARVFRSCSFTRNGRHGVSLRQLGVNMTESDLEGNSGSGLHFNPFITRSEQRELAGWLKLQQNKYYTIPGTQNSVRLVINEPQYFITKTLRNQDVRFTLHVATTHSNVIGIQILNPVSPESTEQLVIYDYQQITESKDIAAWNIRRDQSSFPTTSSSYSITLDYESGPYALGDIIIVLTAVDRRDIAQAGDLRNFRSKWPMVHLQNTQIHNNNIGISTLHYNRYLTDDGDHLLRVANESMMLIDCQINNNQHQAMYVLSPFRTRLDNDNIAEITFMLNGTTIRGNGRGIDQYSWDIRESNNLFHWVLEDTLMESNGGGGLVLALPYVWQYTENYTHTLYVNASIFRDNAQFQFTVDGHFARINMTYSKFEANTCERGLLTIQGMEKEMFIHDNEVMSNTGSYMVKFNTNSQSRILGSVSAYFEYNRVQGNRNLMKPNTYSSASTSHQPASYTIGVQGVQNVNITHNLLGSNDMDYELLAGLFTSRVNNYLNAEANWWGSRRAQDIEQSIFDFDDWNNFALADFLPYLIENSLSAPVSSVGASRNNEKTMDLDTLGGRLLHDLTLPKRSEPYVIKSDLTVMPGATLTIKPGAILEFYPSVGMLVLGRLEAMGNKHDKIIMKLADISTTHQYKRVSRQTKSSLEDVRLCVEGDCDGRSDGFLDIYNGTTKKWVPICDDRFTERNAEVVCHQLGFNPLHAHYARDKRTEMYPNALVRISYWPDPIECDGTEEGLDECPLRMNGQILEHTYDCPWNGDFVYLWCGNFGTEADDTKEFWGGIRFSIPNFEHMDIYERIHDPNSPGHSHAHPLVHGRSRPSLVPPSVLEWVDVMGAGVLHNDKSPAIFAFHEAPLLRGVTVSGSAYDGLSVVSATDGFEMLYNSVVSATDGFEMLYNRFENNMGVGVSLMGLTGETRETEESSFFPVSHLRLPYHAFGFIDACDATKELLVEERVILYYKYDNRPADCVKIFSSVFNVKNFGFRLLQFNMYDSNFPDEEIAHDRIILYDGDIYNQTTQTLAEIHARSDNHMRFFKTQGTSLSVEVHTTGASGKLGFLAEVVTLPVSDLGINRNILHNFTYNHYTNNVEGAVFVATAGEVNPWLCFSYSRFSDNGRQLYANISTTRAAVYLDLQNMQDVYFKNNLVRNNTGGLYILAGSVGAATKLQANITNNLFVTTQHWPALYMASRENSAYQHALLAYNDFSWSYSPYHDVITLAQVVSVFTHNYVHSNLGRHILDIYGFQKVRLPVYQTTSHNSLAKNVAVDPTYQGTVVAGSAGQQFVDNVFYNWDNAYELVAVNESMSGLSRSDVWKTPIDAQNNWWGFNTSVAVSGRIHDKTDDETLLRVDFSKWKLNNYTLLKGCEPGYTLIGDACYLYIGAPLTHTEASNFCKRDNASLPFLQKWYWEVQHWLLEQQPQYLWQYDMVWVQHLDIIRGCAAFVNRQVRSVDCNLNLPFICESDPDKTIDKFAWTSDPLAVAAIAVTIGCIVLVVACVSCWCCKSRQRRKERIWRRNSIRASIRSNRSALSTTTSGGFSDIAQRRIIEDPQRAVAMKGNETGGAARMSNGLSGSFDSIAKSQLNSSVDDEDPSYVVYEETTTQSPPGYSSTTLDNRFIGDPNLENENVNMLVRPSFNMTFQNQGFRDTSREPSSALLNDNIPHHHWDTHNNEQPSSATSSFKQDSSHASTPQLGSGGSGGGGGSSSAATDSTLDMKKDLGYPNHNDPGGSFHQVDPHFDSQYDPMNEQYNPSYNPQQDPHLMDTLPRNPEPDHFLQDDQNQVPHFAINHQMPPQHYVSANVLTPGSVSSVTPSEDIPDALTAQDRSYSQPLETAM
ncbi:hypothetical protein Pmani_006428 [Petrolisthes manimaculis]|uniref:SRCR domain-containing protein n=1 Tax=Petrolisthes manimaculis TaxID=1843537 RepID=A0AAE1QAE6_9EUCA|nr:hypothetical protein Pmani_006428 [Petrolisthes manimaculis]